MKHSGNVSVIINYPIVVMHRDAIITMRYIRRFPVRARIIGTTGNGLTGFLVDRYTYAMEWWRWTKDDRSTLQDRQSIHT